MRIAFFSTSLSDFLRLWWIGHAARIAGVGDLYAGEPD